MPEDTIKILSWNIEHLQMDKIDEITPIIKDNNPDIFSLYEVEAAAIYNYMLNKFPDYTLFITEGQQTQEILVAVKNKFEGIKFQQKKEFKSGNPSLRPGVFLTFRYPGKSIYGMLFLHTDSGTKAVDFGNRNEMFNHAFNLKRKLDKTASKATNFMIMGDLNTMGLKYPKQYKSNIIADTLDEIEYIDFESQKKGKYSLKPLMKRLTKPTGTHYSKTYGISDLDHILASEHLRFTPQTNFQERVKMDVHLGGWREFLQDKTKMQQYADTISDHCYLVCELMIE